MTKGGVFLNLEESTYKTQKYGLIFYFSSMFYMEKFVKNVENYVKTEVLKFENRTNLIVDFKSLFAISYYTKIEKRGFKVETCTKVPIKPYTVYNATIILQ